MVLGPVFKSFLRAHRARDLTLTRMGRSSGQGATGALEDLPGVGPVLARRLQSAGFSDAVSLVYAVPRRYDEVLYTGSVSPDLAGRTVALLGRIRATAARWLRGGKNLATIGFEALRDSKDSAGTPVDAAFFGQSYLARSLEPGMLAVFTGTLEFREADGNKPERYSLKAPSVHRDIDSFVSGAQLQSVYPTIEGFSTRRFQKLVHAALDMFGSAIDEPLPREVLRDLDLPRLPEALRVLHAPPLDRDLLQRCRRRVALDEAVRLMADVRERRARREKMESPKIRVTREIDTRIRAKLPFALSPEQDASVAAIALDLSRPWPMARLLQGDVGTGKTLVAFYACLATAAAGYKAVLLAPTEILAEQHASNFRRWLEGSRLPVELVTGSSVAADRSVCERLQCEPACIVVGTHTLLSDDVCVTSHGLLVIDEQQRFGVAQRARLFRAERGLVPNVLVMTATPIPRTLATALFGDLECSEIRNPPAQRARVRTRLLPASRWPDVKRRIVREVRRGGRVFVVCPRIGDDARADLTSVRRVHAELSELLPTGLVHGNLNADQRMRAQCAFRSGEVACLVGTTVLEVGIDVPEATWMVVLAAERLGLSSLHQLRGRVGRSRRPGLCLLLGDAESERLQLLERTDDGFALAEQDLVLRGAGDLTGHLQHGHWRMSCLDPIADVDLLRVAGTLQNPASKLSSS